MLTVQINTRPDVDRLDVWRTFVERHYHSDWTPDWGGLYPSLYTFIPPRQACARGLPGPYQPEAWHDPASLARVLRQQPADPHPLAELLAQAQHCESLVKHNPLDFQAVIHSIEYLSHLQNRHAAVFQLTQLEDLGSNQVVAALEAVAAADEKLEKILREDWFHSRFQDDPAQDTLLPRLESHDQSLYAIHQAAAFSRSLAEQPARFRQIVDKSRSEL